MKNTIKACWNINRAKRAKVPLLVIALAAVIGFSFTVCDDDLMEYEEEENDVSYSGASSFDGTWNASGGRSFVFNGNTFIYKVNDKTRYSGIFSVSGPTINFNESSLERASGNFQLLSGETLIISDHTWDSGVNGTYANATVTLKRVTADGSDSQTTTQLKLSFTKAITDLNADNITLSGVSGVTKGALSGSGPVYTLPISGFTESGTLSVAVEKSNYTINNSPRTVKIYYIPTVNFNSVTADSSGSENTTQLTLEFSEEIDGLSADDITLSGVSGVTKGTLSGSGTAYTLPITVTRGGTLTVAVAKSGYNITNSPKTVTIYYIQTVTLNSVTANGSGTQNTTQLALTFSQAITGLSAGDITLSGVSGVTKGTLSGSGPTYTLPVTVSEGGTLTVTVAKSGYIINNSSNTVRIYCVEAVLGSYDKWTSSVYTKLSSSSDYQIVNLTVEGRDNVVKVTNPGDWTVVQYDLSAYKNQYVTITFSAEVKRVGPAGMLDWQINNSDENYPSLNRWPNAPANTWNYMSGSWSGIPSDDHPYLYLSTYQNSSDQTTYYIDNFTVTVY